jgi:hypothetical protein
VSYATLALKCSSPTLHSYTRSSGARRCADPQSSTNFACPPCRSSGCSVPPMQEEIGNVEASSGRSCYAVCLSYSTETCFQECSKPTLIRLHLIRIYITKDDIFCQQLSKNVKLSTKKKKQNKKTPWSESASELYRPSDRRL